MKKVFVGGVCASLILGLSACNSDQAEVKAPETAKTETAVAVQQALTSGIDFANFDKSVRPQDDFYDIGAIFGIGFPPFLGGPFRYMDSLGAKHLVETLKRYQDQFGDRFAPCDRLVEMAESGSKFYE